MDNPVFAEAINETYEDIKRMLYNICSKYVTPTRQLDELMSEAHDVFMNCYLSEWDPTKAASFSSWLHQKVVYRMLDLRRPTKEVLVDTIAMEDTITAPEDRDVEDFLDSLPEDARLLAWVILHRPDDVMESMVLNGLEGRGGAEAKKLRQYLRGKLRLKGWDNQRITAAYNDIGKALKSMDPVQGVEVCLNT